MERRVGLRARTDFEVIAQDGRRSSRCRGVEISPTGIVIDRGRSSRIPDSFIMVDLEMRLPERIRRLKVKARPIWTMGSCQAFKFVRISDVDRLTLAEHLDLQRLRGVPLA
jgi:hypothetical protein